MYSFALQDDEIVYEGPETSFVVSGLEEVTEYVFKLRAWTDEDEESGVSEIVKATTFRAGKLNFFCCHVYIVVFVVLLAT